jgi:hypothetical protein
MCVTQNVNNLCNYWLPTVDCIDKDWQIQTRPLVKEGAPQRQDRNFEEEKKKISGQKSQIGLDTKTYWLTDRRS